MSDSTQPPFKVGQQVVRKLRPKYNSLEKKWRQRYGGAFTISVVEYVNYQWVVGDCYLNMYLADNCLDAAIYNSPLWQAMKEDD